MNTHTYTHTKNNYKCKRTVSQIKRYARSHTLRSCGQRPITDRHSMLSQTQNKRCIRSNIPIKQKQKTKHTPLHSTLKDQSWPSPRIQDHTVAAMGGRLAGGGGWGLGKRVWSRKQEWKRKFPQRKERAGEPWRNKGGKRAADDTEWDLNEDSSYWGGGGKHRSWNKEWEKQDEGGEGETWGWGGVVSLVSTSACQHWFS